MVNGPSSTSASPVTRIVVVDDETMAREGLLRLTGPTFEIVAGYSDVETFLAAEKEADMVLLDLWIRPWRGRQPPLRGLSAIRAIAARGPKILIYTSEGRSAVLAQLLRAGAHGVVTKFESQAALVDAIIRVSSGEIVLTTELVGLADAFYGEGLLPRLTPREAIVLRCRAQGLSGIEVARTLHISVSAVDKATTRIYKEFADYLQRVSPGDVPNHPPRSASLLAGMIGLGPEDLLDPYA